MKLYKYLQRQFLEEFFHRGSLKIGTLSEYRNVEAFGPVIGDRDEGTSSTELGFKRGDEVALGGSSPEARFLRNILQTTPQQCSNMKIVSLVDGYNFVSQENSPELYIYCMTEAFDLEVMHQFGCDSCLEITNPASFLSAISHRIRHKARLDGLHPIQYMSRKTTFTSPHQVHPALMKDNSFLAQREWRAVWVPTKKQIRPLFIDVPRAIRYCRPYAPS